MDHKQIRLIFALLITVFTGFFPHSGAPPASADQGSITIMEPLDQTILPANMASIPFSWIDPGPADVWRLEIRSKNRRLLESVCRTPSWLADEQTWQSLKIAAGHDPLLVTVTGVEGESDRLPLSRGITRFRFSRHTLDSPLLFMRKPLPFSAAKKHPEVTELLIGDIASYDIPRNVLPPAAVCANCHAYAGRSNRLAMDLDVGGDKGCFVLADMKPRTVITENDLFSWNRLDVRPPADYHMGLFAGLSPCGRYLASTVNETSVFVMMDDLYFSQLFYPATGHIGIFDAERSTFRRLRGADNDRRVHTCPSWSPDGRTLAFAAAETDIHRIRQVLTRQILNEPPDQTIHELNKKYPVLFDIFTIPFNNGEGGNPEPLKGAAGNGRSNYFPRYSPDGKWIVFTQSPTGLVLQPDSRLCIVPAGGGDPRYLQSNLPVMNSWHSWSSDSRWLVFTCKAASPYTELYLTHINDTGDASPAVRLSRFSHERLAAMVPEFVSPDAVLPEYMAFHLPETTPNKIMATDNR